MKLHLTRRALFVVNKLLTKTIRRVCNRNAFNSYRRMHIAAGRWTLA